MKNILTSLFDYRVKKYALVTATIFITVDILTYVIDDFYLNSFYHHVLFHYFSLIALLSAVTSKDKIDDERSRQIRYSVFKNTLSFSIVIIAIAALFLASMSIKQISTLTIIYILEGMLILHLLLYHLGHRYNPKWLLIEDTAPIRYNRMMIGFFLVMILIVFILIILSVIIEIKGEL